MRIGAQIMDAKDGSEHGGTEHAGVQRVGRIGTGRWLGKVQREPAFACAHVNDAMRGRADRRPGHGIEVTHFPQGVDELIRVVAAKAGDGAIEVEDVQVLLWYDESEAPRLRRVGEGSVRLGQAGTAGEAMMAIGDVQGIANLRRREAWLGEQSLKLTNAEFVILVTLMRAPGEVVSREALTRTALGRQLLPDDRSLDTHISNLRRKLGSDDDADVLIRSIRGSGYVLVPPQA